MWTALLCRAGGRTSLLPRKISPSDILSSPFTQAKVWRKSLSMGAVKDLIWYHLLLVIRTMAVCAYLSDLFLFPVQPLLKSCVSEYTLRQLRKYNLRQYTSS